MCGIAGIISPNGINKCNLIKSSSALRHRGPDGFGFMLYSPQTGLQIDHNSEMAVKNADTRCTVGFAHRRLSIIDLSTAGLQPMADETGTCCVTYNGEIYNYLELRTELEGLGFHFRTNSDTEVLLKAYRAWGPECVRKFNGMWAFALLDIENRRAVMSRDRFGIKPLFYSLLDNSLYFASEIKGLLAVSTMNAQPNQAVVAQYMLTGTTDNADETFFLGIRRFPAAHYCVINLDSDTIDPIFKPYWSISFEPFQGRETDAVSRFAELFSDSVRIHARSDVPVGTCLSGGLDSSSIVCASEKLRQADQIPNYAHMAFGYCASDNEYSEKRHMDVVARATSVKMNYINISKRQFLDSLPQIIELQDEPFGSASIVVQWFVFQEAKNQGITVMLDGQGADETLGGYHSYFYNIENRLIRSRNFFGYLRFYFEYLGAFGKPPTDLGAVLANKLKRVLPKSFSVKTDEQDRNSLSLYLGSLNHSLTDGFFSRQSGKTIPPSLDEELKNSVESAILPALLRYEDRNSMAHSIEARVPFLDYRLVELLFSVPGEWKIKGVVTKNILRKAMKGILPEPIRTRRDKIGFKSSPDLTFDFARDHYKELVQSQTPYEKEWFNQNDIRRFLDSEERTINAEFLLWRIINLKLWLRQYWS